MQATETTLEQQIRLYAECLRAMRDAYLQQAEEYDHDDVRRRVNEDAARAKTDALVELHIYTEGDYGEPRVTTP